MLRDIKNEKYGRLLTLKLIRKEKVYYKSKTITHHIWLCKCDCGNIVEKKRNSLISGTVRSCGCLEREKNNNLKGKGIQKNILPYGEAALNTYYGDYKYRSKKMGFEFELNKEEFKNFIFQNCYYCNVKAQRQFPTTTKNKTRPYNGFIYVNGIDRIDSKQGYIKNNCVTCCEICNKAKRNLTSEEFFEWIERLSEYYASKHKRSR